MDSQPIEILEYILRYLPNLDLTISRQVSKKWRHLIETKILFKQIHPTIEECIIELDYYHFKNFIPDDYQGD